MAALRRPRRPGESLLRLPHQIHSTVGLDCPAWPFRHTFSRQRESILMARSTSSSVRPVSLDVRTTTSGGSPVTASSSTATYATPRGTFVFSQLVISPPRDSVPSSEGVTPITSPQKPLAFMRLTISLSSCFLRQEDETITTAPVRWSSRLSRCMQVGSIERSNKLRSVDGLTELVLLAPRGRDD